VGAAKLQFTCPTAFAFGDCQGQFLPIARQVHAQMLRDIERGNFSRTFCNGGRNAINKFRRGGDQAHFDLVGGVYRSRCTLEVALPRAREWYPARGEPTGAVPRVTHRARVAHNAELNVCFSPSVCAQAATERAALPRGGCAGDRAARADRRCWRRARRALPDEPRGRVARPAAHARALLLQLPGARAIHGELRLAQIDGRCFALRHLIIGLGRALCGACVEVE
jgi:hypothetical protein